MLFYDEIKKILPKPVKKYIRFFIQFPLYQKAKKDPKWITDRHYYKIFGKPINYDNPSDINEKIHWLKFYSDTSPWSMLADKYKVREYVIEKGFGHTLNELYGVYEKASEIDISKLPNSFVMKMNNGSGDILIVKDKSKYTNKQVQKHFKNFKEYGVMYGEYHYLGIEPRIIVEKLLIEHSNDAGYLTDYKFYCCNGKPVYILVCYNRSMTNHSCATFDMEWNLLKEVETETTYDFDKAIIEKPKSFDKMKSISELLANDFPFVRIDWYEIEDEPVFGEMTFTPSGGFIKHYTTEFLIKIGNGIKLPERLNWSRANST